MMCSTVLFAAATQVIAIHASHTEIMHIDSYQPQQHLAAFVWYCDGWPLPVEITGGKLTMVPARHAP